MPHPRPRPWISCRTLTRRWRALRYAWGPRRAALREARRQHNRVDAYWWIGEVNFGDLLTPDLLRLYGYTPVLAPPGRAQLVGCGSLLEHVPDTYRGVILGSGFLEPGGDRPLPLARALAVRGHLTRRRLGLPDDAPVGDPGLLISRLLPQRAPKQYEFGIVPHYRESAAPALLRLRERLGDALHVVDVRRSPAAVAADLDSCRGILASSLHGLITADALGIPNAWIFLEGAGRRSRFKYDDYYSALDVRRDPLALTGEESLSDLRSRMTPAPEHIAAVRETLHRLFRDLPRIVPGR